MRKSEEDEDAVQENDLRKRKKTKLSWKVSVRDEYKEE